MPAREVIVSIRPDVAIGTVADALRARGMTVDQALDELGVITGTVDADAVADLTTVAGVDQVELGRTLRHPPEEG